MNSEHTTTKFLTYDKLVELKTKLEKLVNEYRIDAANSHKMFNVSLKLFNYYVECYWCEEEPVKRVVKDFNNQINNFGSCILRPHDVRDIYKQNYLTELNKDEWYKEACKAYHNAYENDYNSFNKYCDIVKNYERECVNNSFEALCKLSEQEYLKAAGYDKLIEFEKKVKDIEEVLTTLTKVVGDFSIFTNMIPADKNKLVKSYNRFREDEEELLSMFDEHQEPLAVIEYKPTGKTKALYNVYKQKANENCVYVADIAENKDHKRFQRVYIEYKSEIVNTVAAVSEDEIIYKKEHYLVYKTNVEGGEFKSRITCTTVDGKKTSKYNVYIVKK